MILTTGVKEHW